MKSTRSFLSQELGSEQCERTTDEQMDLQVAQSLHPASWLFSSTVLPLGYERRSVLRTFLIRLNVLRYIDISVVVLVLAERIANSLTYQWRYGRWSVSGGKRNGEYMFQTIEERND